MKDELSIMRRQQALDAVAARNPGPRPGLRQGCQDDVKIPAQMPKTSSKVAWFAEF